MFLVSHYRYGSIGGRVNYRPEATAIAGRTPGERRKGGSENSTPTSTINNAWRNCMKKRSRRRLRTEQLPVVRHFGICFLLKNVVPLACLKGSKNCPFAGKVKCKVCAKRSLSKRCFKTVTKTLLFGAFLVQKRDRTPAYW